MLQIIYISTSRTPTITTEQLRQVLATSRINNERDGISGLLLAGGRRFLQALEGPEDAVMRTFARIQADPRHFAFVELSRRQIEEREFGAWSMAYTHSGDTAAGAALREDMRRLTDRLPDPNVRALFTGFAKLHGEAA